jgi:hypothetical protein
MRLMPPVPALHRPALLQAMRAASVVRAIPRAALRAGTARIIADHGVTATVETPAGAPVGVPA